MSPFFPFIETKVVMMMMSSVNFNPHGTKLTRVIMINYAHGVDANFESHFELKKETNPPKLNC